MSDKPFFLHIPIVFDANSSPARLVCTERDVREMRDKYEARIRELTEWRPMSEAPTDTPVNVLCKSDDGYVVESMYRDSRDYWIHDGEPTFCHSYYLDPVGWVQLPEVPRG